MASPFDNLQSFPVFNWFTQAVEVSDPGNVKPNDDQLPRQDQWLYGAGYGGYGFGSTPFGYGRGFSDAPCASPITWRWMERSWPTLALAYSIARALAMAAPYTVECDDGTPDEAKELIENTFIPMMPDLVKGMFRSTSLRYSPFKVVWDSDEDGYQVPTCFEYMVPDITTPLILKNSNCVVGLRQNGADYMGPNAFYYANEQDKVPIYGHSRCENVRESWWQWMEGCQRGGQLDKKAAGVVFTVLGPDTGTNAIYAQADGTMKTGAQVSLDMANRLQQGISGFAPNQLYQLKNANVKDLVELSKASAWNITYHDLGNVGPANMALLSKLQYYDTMAFRGFYLPERTALEGSHGTKAEAGEHAEFGDISADQERQGMCKALNDGPVNNTLEFNFGKSMRGKVRIVPSPIKDGRLIVFRALVDGMLKAGLASQVAQATNMRSVYDQLGIPIRDDDFIDDPANWVGQQPSILGPDGKPAKFDPTNGQPILDKEKDKPMNGNGKSVKMARSIQRIAKYLDDDN